MNTNRKHIQHIHAHSEQQDSRAFKHSNSSQPASQPAIQPSTLLGGQAGRQFYSSIFSILYNIHPERKLQITISPIRVVNTKNVWFVSFVSIRFPFVSLNSCHLFRVNVLC